MNDSLYTNGYVTLEEFFTKQQVDFFMNQVVVSLGSNELHLAANIEQKEELHPATWNVNSHPVWDNLLYSVLPQLSKVADEELVPVYSYQRVYLKDTQMSHHIDWPWCQISLTVNLGQSHSYPLYVTDMETKESVEVIQKPGDAILYLGNNTSHYRNKFEGDWYSQLFFHYVIDNEENIEHHRFDTEVFNFQLKDKMEQIFYPIDTEKLKRMKYTYDMKEEDKNKVVPLEAKRFKTTNRKPRILVDDKGIDAEMQGGQYKTKKLTWFMDSIHQTRNALEPKVCKDIIDLYEDYASKGKVHHGMTHRGIDNDYKNTGEFNLLDIPEGEKFITTIRDASDHCILMYTQKFGLLEHYDPSEITSGGFYDPKNPVGCYYPMWEVHKYEKGVGHYESWHTEGAHHYEYGNRIFTSMFYLNDVEEGGRTVFPFSGAGIKCEEGKHLAFPCYWPYVHYGQTPESDHKYIITTWLQKMWPESYMNTFSKVDGKVKARDVRKTKFIFEKK